MTGLEQGGQARPLLACFGNPLLDIIVSDEEGDLVQSFMLERNVAQEVDTNNNNNNNNNNNKVDTLSSGLYEEVMTRGPSTSGGGCALNTSR